MTIVIVEIHYIGQVAVNYLFYFVMFKHYTYRTKQGVNERVVLFVILFNKKRLKLSANNLDLVHYYDNLYIINDNFYTWFSSCTS